jgi:hypothetical protein
MRNLLSGLGVLAMLFAGVLGSSAQANQNNKRVWKIGILWHAANLEQEAVMFGPFARGMLELDGA